MSENYFRNKNSYEGFSKEEISMLILSKEAEMQKLLKFEKLMTNGVDTLFNKIIAPMKPFTNKDQAEKALEELYKYEAVNKKSRDRLEEIHKLKIEIRDLTIQKDNIKE